MNYPEFREEVLNTLKSMVSKEVTVTLVQAEKLNGCVRFGISFDRADLIYAPTIYLEPFYHSFCRGRSVLSGSKPEPFSIYIKVAESTIFS